MSSIEGSSPRGQASPRSRPLVAHFLLLADVPAAFAGVAQVGLVVEVRVLLHFHARGVEQQDPTGRGALRRVVVLGHNVLSDNGSATEGDLDSVLSDEIDRTQTPHLVVEDVSRGADAANDDPALLIQSNLVSADSPACRT